MSLNFVCVAIVLLSCPFIVLPQSFATPISSSYVVYTRVQKVDHFSYANNDTFEQRVILSADHWCLTGCPIFFYAGNEGDIFTFANNTGFMWENAARFKAMVVFAEHRYYGKSMPYGKESFKDARHIGYLTVEQALADFVDVIEDIKKRFSSPRSPVIVFGGSYGGMLASWMRMKYPHIVEGALASSAPILQFPGLYDCLGFSKVLTKSFAKYGESCVDSIRKSWAAIKRLIMEETGQKWLKDTFKLCEPLKYSNLTVFYEWLADIYGNLGMIDYPNPADFLAPLPAYPIGVACSHLKKSELDDKSLLMNIYNAISVFTNYTGQTKCNRLSDSSIDVLGTDAWKYQTCTEMVLPMCYDGSDDMMYEMSWNMTEIRKDCMEEFNVKPEMNKALSMFGGRNISAASNIIFSNGERDPWSAGGLLKSVNPTVISMIIPNACHHEDLRSSGPNDPETLLIARQLEIKIIKDWIDKYYLRIEYTPKIWIEQRNLI